MTDMNRGDWLFTCRMMPVQFDYIDGDQFYTLDGSGHSKLHCGLRPISSRYALWWNRHSLHTYFDLFSSETSLIEKGTRWEKANDGTLFRKAASSLCYHYRKVANKKYRFSYLRLIEPNLPDFVYYHCDHIFNLRSKNVWDVYEAYLRFRALDHGIAYEGY